MEGTGVNNLEINVWLRPCITVLHAGPQSVNLPSSKPAHLITQSSPSSRCNSTLEETCCRPGRTDRRAGERGKQSPKDAELLLMQALRPGDMIMAPGRYRFSAERSAHARRFDLLPLVNNRAYDDRTLVGDPDVLWTFLTRHVFPALLLLKSNKAI